VVAGECDNSGRKFLVMRFNSNGSLDTSFSGDGIVTTSIGTSCAAYSVAVQADGKIIAAGTSEDKDFALARYNTDGSLDTSFDGDGMLTQHMGDAGAGEQINTIALQTDGKIMVAGYATVTNEVWAIARFNSNGTLDTGFGTGGKSIEWTHSNPADEIAHGPSPGNKLGIQSIALQSDGKIAATGYD